MSDASGLQSTRPFVRGHERHGPLDRPSLFAGSDDDSVPPSTLQGVRILSTLESSRRPPSPPSRRTSHLRGKRRTSRWMQGALWGLLLLGIGGLVTGFAMVVQSSQPAPMRKASTAQPVATTPPQAPTHMAAAEPHGAARIETTTAAQTPPAQPEPATVATATSTSPTHVTAKAASPRKSTDSERKNESAKSNSPASSRQAASRSRDQDVALLEAMLAHTGGRKEPGRSGQTPSQ